MSLSDGSILYLARSPCQGLRDYLALLEVCLWVRFRCGGPRLKATQEYPLRFARAIFRFHQKVQAGSASVDSRPFTLLSRFVHGVSRSFTGRPVENVFSGHLSSQRSRNARASRSARQDLLGCRDQVLKSFWARANLNELSRFLKGKAREGSFILIPKHC